MNSAHHVPVFRQISPSSCAADPSSAYLEEGFGRFSVACTEPGHESHRAEDDADNLACAATCYAKS